MTDAEQLEAALRLAAVWPVSRETRERLLSFVGLLRQWQRVKNLVGAETLSDVWVRHVADSAQLAALAPSALRWLDLGSGAGFPGLVMAILLAEQPGAIVHLVESSQRKAAFLRAVKRDLALPAVVHVERIETVLATLSDPIDAISARALAPLETLAAWLATPLARGARAYLHKGAEFERELEEASPRWAFDLVEHESRIGPGVIVEIRAIRRRNPEEVPP